MLFPVGIKLPSAENWPTSGIRGFQIPIPQPTSPHLARGVAENVPKHLQRTYVAVTPFHLKQYKPLPTPAVCSSLEYPPLNADTIMAGLDEERVSSRRRARSIGRRGGGFCLYRGAVLGPASGSGGAGAGRRRRSNPSELNKQRHR